MILKFESRISNTHVQLVAKLQLDPTVELGDMGLGTGLICTDRMSENGFGPFLHALWTWAFLLGLGPSSWAWDFILGLGLHLGPAAVHLLMGLEKAH